MVCVAEVDRMFFHKYGLRKNIMHCYKSLYSLVVASFLVFSSGSYAAVYDFGNIYSFGFAVTPNSFAQLATTSSSFGKWSFDRNIENNSSSRFNDVALAGSTGFTPDLSEKISSDRFADNKLLSSVAYIDMQSKAGDYDANIPVTDVTESNSYAVMLAGFGLLCFSARRRKSDTFD
jgi:hypothetical protein